MSKQGLPARHKPRRKRLNGVYTVSELLSALVCPAAAQSRQRDILLLRFIATQCQQRALSLAAEHLPVVRPK